MSAGDDITAPGPRLAHFKIPDRFDHADGATFTINRASGIVTVRPKHRKRTYDLPLFDVARMVFERVVRAELAEKRAAKKSKQLVRRKR